MLLEIDSSGSVEKDLACLVHLRYIGLDFGSGFSIYDPCYEVANPARGGVQNITRTVLSKTQAPLKPAQQPKEREK